MQRNCSIELLRIISMIMVVILHINLFGQFTHNVSHDTCLFIFINIYQQLCVIAVNVFVIISAWFLCDKENISTKKIVSLYVDVIWWTIIGSLVAVYLGIRPSIKDILYMVPFVGDAFNFLSGYIIMYVMAPYLNRMIHALSKQELKKIAIGSFIIFVLFSYIAACDYIQVRNGYSFSWFIILYIIVSFIKHNCLETKFTGYRSGHYFLVFVLFAFIGVLIRLLEIPLITNSHYNNPIIVIESISLFLAFQSFDINSPSLRKIILFFSPLSLATFLIHANPLIERWFETLNFYQYFENKSLFYAISTPVLALGVFLLCSLLEFIKTKLFRTINVDRLIDSVTINVNNILNRL